MLVAPIRTKGKIGIQLECYLESAESCILPEPPIACSKLIETLEQGVKYVQS